MNKKILQMVKLAKELVDERDIDFTGFEAGLSSNDHRLFHLKLERDDNIHIKKTLTSK